MLIQKKFKFLRRSEYPAPNPSKLNFSSVCPFKNLEYLKLPWGTKRRCGAVGGGMPAQLAIIISFIRIVDQECDFLRSNRKQGEKVFKKGAI